MKIFVNASNIHQGGGKVLLVDFLNVLEKENRFSQIIVFIDSRFQEDNLFSKKICFFKVRRSLINRLLVDLKIKKKLQKQDRVFYFGNAPPLFNFQDHCSFLFLQNRLLLEKENRKYLNFRQKLNFFYQRLFLKFFYKNIKKVIVQTKTMSRLALEFGIEQNRILLAPYREKINDSKEEGRAKKNSKGESTFIYIADNYLYKNHSNLVKAWEILAQRGIKPLLRLNVTPLFLEKLMGKSLKLKNIDFIEIKARQEVQDWYKKSDVLIYPSFVESFGLPLLEAQDMGLAIIASEKSYIRDVAAPVETFDPHCPYSIAGAIMRYLDLWEFEKIDTPQGFFERLEL